MCTAGRSVRVTISTRTCRISGWTKHRTAEHVYQYITKRVLLVIPTLIGAAALVFILMRLIPGDICVVRLGSSGGTYDPKAIALCHAELGMDRSMIVQFIDFVWGIARLDFGTSMWSGNP